MSERRGLVALEGGRTPMFLPMVPQSQREYGEETARIVDEEIKRVLSEAHQKVRNCLASRREALEQLANLLLEKEVVGRPALQEILKMASGDGQGEQHCFLGSDERQVGDASAQ